MLSSIDYEGNVRNRRTRLKVVPNHALYQAKLRPEYAACCLPRILFSRIWRAVAAATCDWRPRQSLFLFRGQRSTPNSARAFFPLRIRLRFAGPRNQLPDRVRAARPRNISNPDAKNRARLRWRRDASQTTPSV